jgi:DNA polymerase
MDGKGANLLQTTLWLDTETYSECDLPTAGHYAYAEHPSTEIIVVQWAVGDENPVVFDCTEPLRPRPPALIKLLEDPTVLVYAHNAPFDRAVLRECWGVDIPLERWRCSMVQALSHGLPGGLDKIGAALGVPVDHLKDDRGRRLIQLFCKPRPKNMKVRRATRETNPAEWAEFLEYSRQDIVALRAIVKRMPTWNFREPDQALWRLDQRMNDRGFAVDLDFARAAVEAAKAEQDRLAAEMREATDGALSGPSKRDGLLFYVLAEHGVPLPDMRADTLRRRAEDPELPDGVRVLLNLRLESTKTSTSKYKRVLSGASGDGRMHGGTQFRGAHRTGRWAGRGLQPQNFPRPTPGLKRADIAAAIEAIRCGAAGLVLDNVMRWLADAVRGVIVAPPGKKLVVADLSNIEGRGLAELAGEAWKLDAFRAFDAGAGPDLYKVAYGRAFGVPAEGVTKDQRQIGKVQELALGYEGGVGAFLTFAAVYGMDLDAMADAVWMTASTDAIAEAGETLAWAKRKHRSTFGLSDKAYIACEVLKASWRAAHPATVALWARMKEAYRQATLVPGVTLEIGAKLKIRRDKNWLRLKLPSGRYLCYIAPQVHEDGSISYLGVNQYTRQWGRIKTYGGKLAENATQAWACDVMAHNLPALEGAGYLPVLTVHDEVLAETPDTDNYTAGRMAELLATTPPWGRGCPLAAAGFEAHRYGKED